jgi:PKD repeat protein
MQLRNKIWIPMALAALMILPVAGQQTPAPSGSQAPAPGRAGAEGFPIGPPAKILNFTADSTSIERGQSITLSWAVVNADRITLDHGTGIVPTRGSVKITPSATTTYTLAAKGRGGSDTQTVTITVAGTVATTSDSASAAVSDKPIPRMSDGKPDLSGVYIAGFDIHPVGKIELKAGAEKYNVGADYGGDLGERCLPPGVPGATQQPYPLQIVQTPTQVVILYEAYHLFRVIPIDGRPHPEGLDPTWLGNSVGKWDGDTLVVDVTAFNDKTAIGPYRHTTAYHVIERYHRIAYDKIAYEATIEDPNVFAAPWSEAGTLTLHPEWDIQEYVCEENNHVYKELFEKYKK